MTKGRKKMTGSVELSGMASTMRLFVCNGRKVRISVLKPWLP